jgi:hypothetical protein
MFALQDGEKIISQGGDYLLTVQNFDGYEYWWNKAAAASYNLISLADGKRKELDDVLPARQDAQLSSSGK